MPGHRGEGRIDDFRKAALSCPIPAAVELVGEKWAFLILRGAFNDLHHFEEFQAGLGIARNILSDRLGKFVTAGVFERRSDPSDRRKVIYSLTEKGAALMPVVVALRQWGEQWGGGTPGIVLADRRDLQPVQRMHVEAHDGRPLYHGELIWISQAEMHGSSKAAE